MPQALEIDREQVRIVAVQIGVREAARQFGLSEETVKSWSKREGWLREAEEQQQLVTTAQQQLRERQKLPPVAPKAADILRNYSEKTKLGLAKGLAKGAETVAELDGQEVLMAAQQVAQLTKAARDLHDWGNGSGNVTIRLDIVAGQGGESPVIDIDGQVVE